MKPQLLEVARMVFCIALLNACGGSSATDSAVGGSVDLAAIDQTSVDADTPNADLTIADLQRAAEDGAQTPTEVVLQLAGVTVSTFVGSEVGGIADGIGTAAQLLNPAGIVVDPAGILYVTEYDANRVRKITLSGQTSEVVSQTGFALPFAIALGNAGELIVQTDANDVGAKNAASGTLWRVSLDTGVAQKIVGDLGRPRGLFTLGGGKLLVADRALVKVSILTSASGLMTLVTGSPPLHSPLGVGVLPDGTYLVADSGAQVIRQIHADNSITIFAGAEGIAGMVDGPKASARFDRPVAIAIDAAGNVYVSDQGENHRIRRIDTAGNVMSIAGDGSAGFRDGEGSDAQLYGQEGIAWSATTGSLYVADGNGGDGTGHHRVRRITLP